MFYSFSALDAAKVRIKFETIPILCFKNRENASCPFHRRHTHKSFFALSHKKDKIFFADSSNLSTKEIYEAARGWKEFTGRIVELDLTDIDTVEGRSHEEIFVYDLSGRNLVGKSQHGINIIRTSDGKTRKVLVK